MGKLKDFFRPGLCPFASIVINIGMRNEIVQSLSPVTLIGAGDVYRPQVKRALRIAPSIVAADGGANVAASMGLDPLAVIGDLDSISPEVRAAVPPGRLIEVGEQDTTDFEKALTRIKAPLTIGLGFAGTRADHALAVWNTLARHPDRPCVILARDDLAFLAPLTLDLPVASGTRVSLFPLAPVEGQSEGLHWPIAGIDFSPAGRIGTSNVATGHVRLSFSASAMLVILPQECLRTAAAALMAAGA